MIITTNSSTDQLSIRSVRLYLRSDLRLVTSVSDKALGWFNEILSLRAEIYFILIERVNKVFDRFSDSNYYLRHLLAITHGSSCMHGTVLSHQTAIIEGMG